MLGSQPLFAISTYVIVAFAIALIAFGLAQVVPGSGVVFVALASTLWTAYSVRRQRRLDPRC